MQKAFKYRFYPTPEQETLLRRTIGCTRLVYNRALSERTQAGKSWSDSLNTSVTGMVVSLSRLTVGFRVLNDVDIVVTLLKSCH
jgi:putative transposase